MTCHAPGAPPSYTFLTCSPNQIPCFVLCPAGVPAGAALPPGTLATLQRLERLDLSAVGLTAFPSEVLQLAGTLRTLKLRQNR